MANDNGVPENIAVFRVIHREWNGRHVYMPLPSSASDGYYTFDELYEHRAELYIALSRLLGQVIGSQFRRRVRPA
jgi:hypothetical protein